ncbi:MAG TPA: ABC transporter permease [Gemmatimonadales bacterium]|jgi:predicted permease
MGLDLRFALRQLRRNPAFTLAAALTLALGVAATTTVFSFVDAALLRPLPYPDPSRLFVLWNARAGTDRETLSYPNFLDYRTRAADFESMALYRRRRFNVTAGGEPERIRGALVTADFFRTLGVTPAPGRDLAEGEDQPAQDRVVIVSERFWRRRLDGAPGAIGRVLRVDGVALEVVGVVPDRVGYPSEAEVWVPVSHEARWLLESRGLQGYTVIGRLREGASPAAAQTQLATIASGLEAEHPQNNAGWTVRLESLQSAMAGDTRPTLLLLFGSAAILLLVATVNLASMLLARAATRRREIAVRRAVGAGDGRLVRQLLTESLLLAGIGGVLGVIFAVWGVQAWRVFWESPGGSPALVRVDWRVVAFALGLTIATALLFGLAPAVRLSRSGTAESLRSGGGTGGLRRGGRVLVAGEIGLALMLGIGGTLLVRSLLKLQAVNPGFDRTGVLAARVSLPETTYKEPKRVVAYYRGLLSEIERLPGVVAAGAGDVVPLIPGGGGSFGFAIQGRPTPPPQEWPIAAWASVTPGYFRALGIQAVAGRLIEEADDASRSDVVLVNQAMARTFWPGRSPVGARITFEADQKHWLEVVGVVADVRSEALAQPAKPQVYVAHAQWGDPGLSLVVRGVGDPLQLIGPIRAIAQRLDPEIPVAEARSMEEAIGQSMVSERLRTAIFTGFASLALLLAAVGIYGVMAFLVVQRKREIALRIALGARRRAVIGGVIRQSLSLAAPGVILGLAGALAASRALRGFLYGVPPTDPLSVLAACIIVAILVTVAALTPARRAADTDPMHTLRSE